MAGLAAGVANGAATAAPTIPGLAVPEAGPAPLKEVPQPHPALTLPETSAELRFRMQVAGWGPKDPAAAASVTGQRAEGAPPPAALPGIRPPDLAQEARPVKPAASAPAVAPVDAPAETALPDKAVAPPVPTAPVPALAEPGAALAERAVVPGPMPRPEPVAKVAAKPGQDPALPAKARPDRPIAPLPVPPGPGERAVVLRPGSDPAPDRPRDVGAADAPVPVPLPAGVPLAAMAETGSALPAVEEATGLAPSATVSAPARAEGAAQALPVATRDPAPPVTTQIAAHLAAADGPVTELHLSPEELGSVRIEIRTEGDRLTMTVTAERTDTLDLLRRNADRLASDLRSAGFDRLDLSFNGGAGGQARQDDRPAALPDYLADRGGPAPGPDRQMNAPPSRQIPAGAGLYLRV